MLELVIRNLQAVWASAAMAAPKKGGFRLVSDYRAVNKQSEKVPGVVPNHEAEMADLRGKTCFGKLDMLQGYGRCRWQSKPRKCSPLPPPKVYSGKLNQLDLSALNCLFG